MRAAARMPATRPGSSVCGTPCFPMANGSVCSVAAGAVGGSVGLRCAVRRGAMRCRGAAEQRAACAPCVAGAACRAACAARALRAAQQAAHHATRAVEGCARRATHASCVAGVAAQRMCRAPQGPPRNVRAARRRGHRTTCAPQRGSSGAKSAVHDTAPSALS